MTKREYLTSIGYSAENYSPTKFTKLVDGFDSCSAVIDLDFNEFCIDIWDEEVFETQKDIDNLQIAFNNVKRDYEEMQKYD